MLDRGYLAEVGATLRSDGKPCRKSQMDPKQWLSICWEFSKIIKQSIVNKIELQNKIE